jgi:predicted RNA-binding protein YlqC (UPF0109 family)
MQELVSFILKGLVSNPDAVSVKAVDGESSIFLEIDVADSDRLRIEENDFRVLRNIRTVANAAAGRKHAIVELLDADVADVGTAQEE